MLVRYMLFRERITGTDVICIAHVQWVKKALMKAVRLAPPSLTISLRIFITSLSTAESKLSDPALCEKTSTSERIVTSRDSFSSLLSLRGAKMEYGRPNLDAMLKEEISSASGRMSVSGKYLGSQFPLQGCECY
jgi:hypothetical protein